VFHDFALADRILGLSRNTERAIRADRLDRATGTRRPAEISAGPFLASSPVFLTVVRGPA
jgi:hypothetical protein